MLNTRASLAANSVNTSARQVRSDVAIAAIAVALFVLVMAGGLQAQTTLTWASPGVSPNIADAGNWVGGVAPNFAGDATTDSAIFSTSTNTAVRLRDVTTGDPFATVTFDANAPAYSFGLPTGNTTNELVILPGGNITNSSNNTQNLTGISALTLNGAAGTPGTLFATSGNAGTKLAFDVNRIKFNNPGGVSATGNANTSVVDLSAGFDVRTNTILGVHDGTISSSLYVLGEQTQGTGGTLFITGDSGSNTGRLVIGIGAVVRISHNNALGDPTMTIPVNNANNQTVLLGGGRNGRLELTGNITVSEGFQLIARQNNVAEFNAILAPAILNVSGNNTLTGPFAFGTGGNAYNFGSDAGTLTIQSDLSVTTSAERYITFQHAGNIVVNGNISSTVDGNNTTLVKYDSGTTTINGPNNQRIGHFSIRGGTLALGPAAGVSFAVASTDVDVFDPRNQAPLGPEGQLPRVTIDEGATFDVSAKAGGYTLTQTLQGKGTVKGTVNMASGTRVRPGAINFYDGQGMSVSGTDDGVGKLTFQGSASGGGGDYNGDGSVNAADYVVWRKNPAAFGGDPAGYNTWRTNFGSSGGGGATGLNLSAGASLIWQIGALSTSNPGTDFDQIVINNGNLTLGGTSKVELEFHLTSAPDGGDPFWNSAHSWKIIDTTSNTGNTNFASITNGTFGPGHFTTTVGAGADAGDIFLNYVLGGAGLSSDAVPEPSMLLLLALSALSLLCVRKR